MDTHVKEVVRQKYGEAARRVTEGAGASCCGPVSSGCGAAPAAIGGSDPITANLYDAVDASTVPDTALLASLGCGNPTALAELKPGETVLDLGSGGGIDVLLAARRVGPPGVAYGVDMTDEMLALAQENKRKSGLANVHFLKGDIEHIPLPANSLDVIISNCVINLAADKDRVLKPGGRFAVSDVVVRGEVPPAIRRNMELWIGCVAGALSDRDYLDKLARVGFADADLEVTRMCGVGDAREFLAAPGADLQQLAAQVDGWFASGFIRATKPPAGQIGTAAGSAAQTGSAPPATPASAGMPDAAVPRALATDAAPCCSPGSCCGR